ncbi:Hermansky-Pudlak syndrome 5 protein homolog [Pectinophora gossypiella]|uniref:RING-type domain-containing protein n=2 Tax=Pectinophora gossypiella TaxID=13191 RepID=A0A1E1WP95_PECGO|nr:Hermansky-Pudlak syndrome 5 protein homolog [Pectinophora gossypiella]
MSSSDLPPYILQELPDITESINYPIKDVQRIKYTCFDVSKTLIAFGATSGGIYVFNRTPCEFVQLIPNKDGAITRLAISTNEKHIAYANGRGIVTVTECEQALSGGHSSVASKEHQGNEVTSIVWSGNNVFSGDDVGRISVLQVQSFIAKTMFQTSTQTIMNLDSRICQLDVKDCMLLVSTLTRCYICDTAQEQYRQIGQKLRDGEFGACFVNQEKNLESGATVTVKDFTEAKTYNIVHDEEKFAIGKGLENILIYCARPSSRLWEATIDGTVRRTHQFKQVLSKKPMKVITVESYNNESFNSENLTSDNEGQSVNFPKIYSINGAIYSFKKDGLYFLDIHDETNSMWFDTYADILDSKLYLDNLYLWLSSGSLVSLKFMKIDKFLVKCYIDEKYTLCAELCLLFCNYLLQNNLPSKLHILVGLREKINSELLKKIENVLHKFEDLKSIESKSGIYVLDNTFKAQSSLDEADENVKQSEDKVFSTIPPEALQTLKDLSVSVTCKFTSSKKMLKEKWEDFEGKMKHLNIEKQPVQPVQEILLPKRISHNESPEDRVTIEFDNTDIIYKESSQKAVEVDNNSIEEDKVCKSLYQYFRLSLVGKETEQSTLISIIESYACDISKIYKLMLLLEQYCLSVGALEESKFVPNNIFLSYLSFSSQKDILLDDIIKDEVLYKYFVDSCISVNMKTQKLSNLGCECGYPLPFNRTNRTPAFSELIDEFIEKQWGQQTRNQCYEICKKMPYLWRKILYLRRNEDLLTVLRLLLQMLDENLLHSFLPQFTLDTWDRAVQLYSTLHANMCLNCNRKFDNISVKETLSWDDIGGLIIKSIGGKHAIKIMEKHANLIDPGEITMKFYHTCLLVTMYEKYDGTITNQLTDALYSSYEFDDAREQIYNLLRSTYNGRVKNTALPLIVAAKTIYWGLSPLMENLLTQTDNETTQKYSQIKNTSINDIINNITNINNGVTDCMLCGLPLHNDFLIKDGGLWVFKCGHTFHGACLDLNKVKLCPACSPKS